MNVSPVSFGKVIVATGNPKKMSKVNKKLVPYQQKGQLMLRDLTHFYRTASPEGEFAQAAQHGNSVTMYITGGDVKKVQNKEPGWSSIKDILTNLEDSFNIKPMFISDVVDRILGR